MGGGKICIFAPKYLLLFKSWFFISFIFRKEKSGDYKEK